MGGLIIAGVLIVALTVGYGWSKFTKKDDSPVEEAAEAIAEDLGEDLLGLPDGTLEGKIDLTPKSKEENKKDK